MIKRVNKLVLGISFLFLIISITAGCGMGKEAEIKKSFEKTLSMYPIKNLEDLYDKEGYRDDEFDKNDKGTWIIGSEMATQNKGEALKVKGMVLYMNRNTKTTKGFYYVNAVKKDGDISYNPEVPSYSAKYQLTNDDYNVKQLRKRYDIPTNKAPKLLLKGSGDLKGSSVGYKDIEFTFVEKKGKNTFFTDSLHLEPSEDK
ncbi:tandem-type lipoprotein [Staphylococcus aureus]